MSVTLPQDAPHIFTHTLENKTFIIKGIVKEDEESGDIKILPKLDHPNIVKVYRIFDKTEIGKIASESKHDQYKYSTGIMMEYLNSGDIIDDINRNGAYKLDKIFYVLRSLAAAIKYIHDKHIIHRDIKPENILMSSKNEVKLTDFGMSLISNVPLEGTKKGARGTPAYIAPESLFEDKISKKSDIYNFGGVIYVLIYSTTPWASYKDQEIRIALARNETPIGNDFIRKDIPYELAVLCTKCYRRKPEDRPDIDQIIETLDRINPLKDKSSAVEKV